MGAHWTRDSSTTEERHEEIFQVYLSVIKEHKKKYGEMAHEISQKNRISETALKCKYSWRWVNYVVSKKLKQKNISVGELIKKFKIEGNN